VKSPTVKIVSIYDADMIRHLWSFAGEDCSSPLCDYSFFLGFLASKVALRFATISAFFSGEMLRFFVGMEA
jgi:hypothetical protein